MNDNSSRPTAREILMEALRQTQSERENVYRDNISYLQHLCSTSMKLFRTFILVQESKKLSVEEKLDYSALLMAAADKIENEIHRIENGGHVSGLTDEENDDDEQEVC